MLNNACKYTQSTQNIRWNRQKKPPTHVGGMQNKKHNALISILKTTKLHLYGANLQQYALAACHEALLAPLHNASAKLD